MTGEEMKTRREALDMSRESLAPYLGCTASTVWRWEHEDGKMPAKMIDTVLSKLEAERQEVSR